MSMSPGLLAMTRSIYQLHCVLVPNHLNTKDVLLLIKYQGWMLVYILVYNNLFIRKSLNKLMAPFLLLKIGCIANIAHMVVFPPDQSKRTRSNVSQILKIEKGYFLYLIWLWLQGRIIKCPMSIRLSR